MAEINDLEIVDASNTVRWAENMRVNAVNNSARALEGIMARGLKDIIDGAVTTAGTSTAYTVASNRTLSAYYDGMTITVQWNATCGATPTVNVDSIGAKNLYFPGGAQVTTGDLLIGARSIIQYDGTNFQVLTGSSIDTDASLTAHEADTTTHGVSGAIVGISDSQTLTNKTIVAANNTITTAASGNLTSTELNAALAELQTDVDTKTTLAAAQAATAADVVSTNADVVTTNADAATTTQDAIDTAADVVSTNADVVSTNADVVSTGNDVTTTNANVVLAQAAAYGWTTVTDITAATTNLEVTDARKYYILDATSNTIAINLPAIGSDEGVLYAFEVKNVDNAITIVRDGTDYINGVDGNYSGLTTVGDIIYVTSDDNSPDNWLIVFVSRVPTATTTTEGKVELLTTAELNTGTDATRAATADAIAGSNYGTAVVPLIPFDSTTACAVGDHAGSVTFRVPSILNGWNLVGVAAANNTAGTTGTGDYQIHNVTQAADMLTTKITIDTGETDSSTAATAAVIDTANDDVATGDQIRVDVDAIQTTPATGLMVELQFRLP